MRRFNTGTFLAHALIAITVAGSCATAQPPKPVPPADIVRAGVLTVGIVPGSVQADPNDLSTPVGFTPDLVNAFAVRLGVKVAWRMILEDSKVGDHVGLGDWDMAVIDADLAAAGGLDFVGTTENDLTLWVPDTSPIKSFKDADQPGMRIAAGDIGAAQRLLPKAVKAATIVSVETRIILVQPSRWDAWALYRDTAVTYAATHGGRVLDDNFASVLGGPAIRKGRPELLAFIKSAAADNKASGQLQRTIDKWKLVGVRPAP